MSKYWGAGSYVFRAGAVPCVGSSAEKSVGSAVVAAGHTHDQGDREEAQKVYVSLGRGFGADRVGVAVEVAEAYLVLINFQYRLSGIGHAVSRQPFQHAQEYEDRWLTIIYILDGAYKGHISSWKPRTCSISGIRFCAAGDDARNWEY